MGSFLRKGRRQSEKKIRKEVKNHTKEFYKILADMDELVKEVESDEYKDLREQLTEDNLHELLQPLTKRKIDKMETLYLKGRLGFYESMEADIQNGK